MPDRNISGRIFYIFNGNSGQGIICHLKKFAGKSITEHRHWRAQLSFPVQLLPFSCLGEPICSVSENGIVIGTILYQAARVVIRLRFVSQNNPGMRNWPRSNQSLINIFWHWERGFCFFSDVTEPNNANDWEDTGTKEKLSLSEQSIKPDMWVNILIC